MFVVVSSSDLNKRLMSMMIAPFVWRTIIQVIQLRRLHVVIISIVSVLNRGYGNIVCIVQFVSNPLLRWIVRVSKAYRKNSVGEIEMLSRRTTTKCIYFLVVLYCRKYLFYFAAYVICFFNKQFIYVYYFLHSLG